MKRVYSFQHDSDRYLALLAKRNKDQDIMLAINGGERPDPWVPPQIKIDSASRKLPRGDFLNFDSIPQIVTSRCRQLLLPLVRDHVEFLPLPFGAETLHLMNVRTYLDCIDQRRTKWKGIEEFLFKDPAFVGKKLGKVPIFSIPENRCCVFVQQGFVDWCSSKELRGLRFTEEWASE